MIHFSRVNKAYKSGLFKKKVVGVRDLFLEVQSGEVFGLIGPNGAGKSTTIKLMLALLRPDNGKILFRGQPLASSDFRRHIGYLPENPYLYDHLSLKELLWFGGKASGMSSDRITEKGRYLIDRMGLSEVDRRPLRTFSKGMLQKAAICFSILHDPAMVILDEPMSGLDPIGRKLVFDLVLELKDQGKTIFFCSHILSDVERLCDRIGFMHRGQLVRTIDPGENFKDKVYIVIDDPSELLTKELQNAGGACRTDNGRGVVETDPGSLAEIMILLQNHKVIVRDIIRKEFALEDLFLQIVEDSDAG